MNGLFGFLVQNWILSVPLLIVLIALLVIEFRNRNAGGIALPSQHAVQFMNQRKSLVIDLRSKEQFDSGHIVNAKRFDQKTLKQDLTPLKKYKEAPILVICEAGIQASSFASWLLKQGFGNVKVLQGGLRQWRKEGLPIIKGNA